MVDDNLTKRKLALLHKLETIRVFEPLHGLTERKDFLRDYLCRKEKLEHIDAVKYRNLLLVESIKTTSLLIHSTSSCSLRRSKSRKRTSTSEVGH